MTRFLSLLILVVGTQIVQAQSADESIVRQILDRQTKSWNKGDLEEFMSGYWKSDSLMFIGRTGVTYGWQKTLDNYRRGYPDRAAMGTLRFDILEVQTISADCIFVVGKWHLARTVGDLQGHFSLVWRKINGEWKIVSDHSS